MVRAHFVSRMIQDPAVDTDNPAKPDSTTKEVYSATQFGLAAIDIFGMVIIVGDVTTDKWWPDCSILIFVAVHRIRYAQAAIISDVTV